MRYAYFILIGPFTTACVPPPRASQPEVQRVVAQKQSREDREVEMVRLARSAAAVAASREQPRVTASTGDDDEDDIFRTLH